LSEPQSADAGALAPDSPAWFAWLAERSSFAFHGQAGSFTARLEAVQRGERYWYAQRRYVVYSRGREQNCQNHHQLRCSSRQQRLLRKWADLLLESSVHE